MTPLCASLADELQLDFSQACVQLDEARLQQAKEDTPATRAAVVRWLCFPVAQFSAGPSTRPEVLRRLPERRACWW